MSHTKAEALTKIQQFFVNAHKKVEAEVEILIEEDDPDLLARYNYNKGQQDAYKNAIGLIAVIEITLEQGIIQEVRDEYSAELELLEDLDYLSGSTWTPDLVKKVIARLEEKRAAVDTNHPVVDHAQDKAEGLISEMMLGQMIDDIKDLEIPE